MRESDVVVVGAGPAGLATALALQDAGVRPLVIDRAEEVGASWRGRYDRLRLNSPKRLSHLPGRRFARDVPTFPTRDQVVAHLEEHAAGLDLLLGTTVERIERDGERWLLRTDGAGDLRAAHVVVATGHEHAGVIPDWPGRDTFPGPLVHSSAYRNPAPYAGLRVLVVGPGCSGMEIAHDLAEGGAAQVWLAARTPPNIVLRTGPGGLPGDYVALALLHTPPRFADRVARVGRKLDLGDLTPFGLPVPEEGMMTRLRRRGLAPAIVDREVIDAIKARRFTVVRGVTALDGRTVTFDDGDTLEVDAIIAATGFARGLEPLVGHLEVLDETGEPRRRDGGEALPGLRFVGYDPRPAMIGHSAKQATRAAREIARAPAAAAAR